MNHFQASGSEPNPHALAALVRASETYAIVASQDIVDVRGLKLWAQGQPVSSALQQRLLERRLQKPLETCLEAEDGVTVFTLLDDLSDFVDSPHPLAKGIRPFGDVLEAQLKRIPLHAVAQLMLTAALASRPSAVQHAVEAMALAGAMMASRNASEHDIRLAMLAGLLHDIGEVYIHPQYLDYAGPLDLVGHKHLVVHPRVGQMLLSSLTDYPALLTRAVAEHHERLDGSGYPARLAGDDVSTLGRVLSVVETTLGVISDGPAPLARASFALRVVPGEFDMPWSSFVCNAAREADEAEAMQIEVAAPQVDLCAQLANIDWQLAQTTRLAHDLQEQRRTSKITDVVGSALARLERLRQAWNGLGLWHDSAVDASLATRFELELASSELEQRMRSFRRECLLLSEGLGETEKARLSPLWKGLVEGHAQ
jgi:HD superfamily phosphohydrolase YqeK